LARGIIVIAFAVAKVGAVSGVRDSDIESNFLETLAGVAD